MENFVVNQMKNSSIPGFEHTFLGPKVAAAQKAVMEGEKPSVQYQ